MELIKKQHDSATLLNKNIKISLFYNIIII